jgi:hypothetical protein
MTTDSPVDVKALAERLRAKLQRLDETPYSPLRDRLLGEFQDDMRLENIRALLNAPLSAQEENERLRQHIKLHAGDTLSLSNDVETFRDHWNDAEARASRAQEEAAERRAIFAALDTTGTGDAVPANLSEALANIAALEAGVASGRRAQEEAAGLRVDLAAAKSGNRYAVLEAHALTRATRAESKLADAVGVLERIANAPAWGAPDRWEPTPFEVRQLACETLTSIKESGDAR